MKPRKLRSIPVTGIASLGAESAEVARIWITNRKGSTVLIDAGVLSDAEMFGVLMADVIDHAAKAHAAALGMTEEQAAVLIWRGVDRTRSAIDATNVADTHPFAKLN